MTNIKTDVDQDNETVEDILGGAPDDKCQDRSRPR